MARFALLCTFFAALCSVVASSTVCTATDVPVKGVVSTRGDCPFVCQNLGRVCPGYRCLCYVENSGDCRLSVTRDWPVKYAMCQFRFEWSETMGAVNGADDPKEAKLPRDGWTNIFPWPAWGAPAPKTEEAKSDDAAKKTEQDGAAAVAYIWWPWGAPAPTTEEAKSDDAAKKTEQDGAAAVAYIWWPWGAPAPKTEEAQDEGTAKKTEQGAAANIWWPWGTEPSPSPTPSKEETVEKTSEEADAEVEAQSGN